MAAAASQEIQPELYSCYSGVHILHISVLENKYFHTVYWKTGWSGQTDFT